MKHFEWTNIWLPIGIVQILQTFLLCQILILIVKILYAYLKHSLFAVTTNFYEIASEMHVNISFLNFLPKRIGIFLHSKKNWQRGVIFYAGFVPLIKLKVKLVLKLKKTLLLGILPLESTSPLCTLFSEEPLRISQECLEK